MPFRNSLVNGGGDLIRESLQSPNFSLGETVEGWQIKKDGSATFNNLTIGSPDYIIDSDGNAAVQTLSVEGIDSDGDGVADSGMTVYGVEFLEYLNRLPRGNIARGNRTTAGASTNTTTTIPYLQLDFTMEPGRLYRVHTSPFFLAGGAVGDRTLAFLHYRINDGAAQVTDPYRSFARMYQDIAGATGTVSLADNFGSANGGELSVLVSYRAEVGTGFITAAAGYAFNLWADDIGLLTADTGIDRSNVAPPATKKNYVSTWTATNSNSYNADGSARTDTADLVQGYTSSYGHGNQYAKAVFAGNAVAGETTKTIAQALSGATITKVEVSLYMKWWYYINSGTVVIRPHNSTALTSTTPSGSSISVASWGVNSSKWVNITSIATSAIRGFSIGPGPSTSGTYYGRADGHSQTHKPQIRISYTR